MDPLETSGSTEEFFFSLLPQELYREIFSNLDLVTLNKASLVSKTWQYNIEHNTIRSRAARLATKILQTLQQPKSETFSQSEVESDGNKVPQVGDFLDFVEDTTTDLKPLLVSLA